MNNEQSAIAQKKEIRLGIVFLGGVSLAIYENGVAQELLRMVRATAAPASSQDSTTEAVYRNIVAYLRSTKGVDYSFKIDILSGTSAGGINAVFLGKALSLGADLKTLHDLWLAEADLATLLNTKASLQGVRALLPALARPVSSLLNSDRMYALLYDALANMNPSDGEESGSPLAEACDAWITMTDLQGMQVPIRLSYQQANEQVHKHAFHFRFERNGTNQFGASYDASLAFAARCTSSFPVAFAPMAIPDINKVLTPPLSPTYPWPEFFESYTVNQSPYKTRYFADGGYLHNKPFAFVVDELLTRRANVPVERKLVYIDPFPEAEKPTANSGTGSTILSPPRPTAFANGIDAASTLPRYQTIREEVTRVMDHNRLVERVSHILTLSGPKLPPPHHSYWLLRASSVTDEIARMIGRAFGFADESMYTLALRALVRAWRDVAFLDDKESAPAHSAFLQAFDLNYYIRRLDWMLELLGRSADRQDDQLLPPYRAAADALSRAKNALYSYSATNPLRGLIGAAQNRDTDDPRWKFGSLEIERQDLLHLLGLEREEVGLPHRGTIAQQNASKLLGKGENFKVIQGIAGKLESFISAAVLASQQVYKEVRGAESSDLEIKINGLYYEFDKYDAVIFPITFGTGLGEGSYVDVIRISPADRVCFKKLGRPLMGDYLAAFGGFLDRTWRQSDLLWGRIDAAEQLITAILYDCPQSDRQDFIVQACEAILDEEKVSATRLTGKVQCQQELDKFNEGVSKPIPTSRKLMLVGHSTRIAGEVLLNSAVQSKSSLLIRCLAGGLTAIAFVLGTVAVAAGAVASLFSETAKSRSGMDEDRLRHSMTTG